MNIIYTGLFAYPDSNANSIRVCGVVDMLRNLGHSIKIIPGLQSKKNICTDNNVVEVDEYNKGIFSGINGVRGAFVGDNTIRYLEELDIKPDLIILYGTHLSYLIRLINYTKKNNIKLVLDVVEWYDPRHLPGGLFGPFAIMNELSMRFFVKRADGLIVISEYLKKYYHSQGCKTFLLPPLFVEKENITIEKFSKDVINFCYVGTPGKKENFEVLCDSLERIYNEKNKFYMHFVGFTKDQFLMNKIFKKYKFINDDRVCHFYGRLENIEAKKIISKSHFSIFFRPSLRFINAGFPSKLAESFSLGTSVICNDISDVSKYIRNSHNGFILNTNFNKQDLYVLLKLILLNNKEEYMQKEVIDTYYSYFHKDKYLNSISKFIESV